MPTPSVNVIVDRLQPRFPEESSEAIRRVTSDLWSLLRGMDEGRDRELTTEVLAQTELARRRLVRARQHEAPGASL